ncbi:hypothetical protein BVI434_1760004 [Burkholderia vietnamiensis]|nr:hypothetical protein BVI434_1760004 [Burkholderia vietnamiensis]
MPAAQPGGRAPARAAARAGVGRRGELSGSGGRRARRRRACGRPPNPPPNPPFLATICYNPSRFPRSVATDRLCPPGSESFTKQPCGEIRAGSAS